MLDLIDNQLSDQFNIDPNRVGILGFSAGGHLAATASTLFNEPNPEVNDELESQWDVQGTSYPPEKDKVYDQRLL